MQYVILSGSHRQNSQSQKVSNWLMGHLDAKNSTAQVECVSLAGNPFPFWDESAWNPSSELAQQMAPVKQKFADADGLIIVAPEWAGMAPAGVKNLLLFLTSKELAHKPCLLVGVSSGRGGTYPITDLRNSGYKNNRMLYIPDHLILRDVEKIMNDDSIDGVDESDKINKDRALYCLDILEAYTQSLKPMRDKGGLLRKEYPFGM